MVILEEVEEGALRLPPLVQPGQGELGDIPFIKN